jgi:hypothetical protein
MVSVKPEWRPLTDDALNKLATGTGVFLVSDGEQVTVASVDKWSNGWEFTDELGSEDELYGRPSVRFVPTHWMPLPEPPK